MAADEELLIVGGGTMGCAAAWALARRGHRVRVLERFGHLHDRGSHGGFTRVIRHAYHEGAGYLRLVDEADRQWEALGGRRGQEILARRGLLEFGAPDDPEFTAALEALAMHAVEHERLTAEEAMRRWPVQMPDHWLASFTPRSGFVRVGAALDAFRAEAEAAGAVFEYGVQVRELVLGDRPRLLLDSGELRVADKVVVAPGAYAPGLMPKLMRAGPRGRVHALRRVLAWTQPPAQGRAALEAMPVWAAFVPDGFFYGFPYGDEGVEGFKVACHVSATLPAMQDEVDPETLRREVDPADLEPIDAFLAEFLPTGQGDFVHQAVCMYGQSPDGDFVVDLHPDDPRVCVCVGFSGHGFKFAPVIGMMVADLVEGGRSTWQLPRFRWSADAGASARDGAKSS